MKDEVKEYYQIFYTKDGKLLPGKSGSKSYCERLVNTLQFHYDYDYKIFKVTKHYEEVA